MITTFSTPASSCADAAARVVVRCVCARALCRRRRRLTSVVPLKACTTPERVVVVDIARRRCLLLESDDIHPHPSPVTRLVGLRVDVVVVVVVVVVVARSDRRYVDGHIVSVYNPTLSYVCVCVRGRRCMYVRVCVIIYQLYRYTTYCYTTLWAHGHTHKHITHTYTYTPPSLTVYTRDATASDRDRWRRMRRTNGAQDDAKTTHEARTRSRARVISIEKAHTHTHTPHHVVFAST